MRRENCEHEDIAVMQLNDVCLRGIVVAVLCASTYSVPSGIRNVSSTSDTGQGRLTGLIQSLLFPRRFHMPLEWSTY